MSAQLDIPLGQRIGQWQQAGPFFILGDEAQLDLSFTGNYIQKVDSKRRMSVPADYRAVLEKGDPKFEATGVARMYLLFGPHLKDHIRAFTVAEFDKISYRINKNMKQGSPEHRRTAWLILSHSIAIEVDRDGRVILPPQQREKIGLADSAHIFGYGSYFEIWDKAEATDAFDDVLTWLEEQGECFDPMSNVPDDLE